MDWLELSTHNCSVQRTLALVGEKWTLLIIRDAANGVHRFDDFHRHVGLSQPVLARRLRTLVAAGILERRLYRLPGKRSRPEYHLTRKGWDLHPVLVALMQWGDRYLADAEGPPIRLVHGDCGAPLRAVVECSRDRTPVAPRDARVLPGPSATSIAGRRQPRRARGRRGA